jgi:hypothetical protein
MEFKSRALYNARKFLSIKNFKEGCVDKSPGIPGVILPQMDI